MTIDVFNPATGQLHKSYEEMSQEELSTIIDKMDAQQKEWAKLSIAERAPLMHKAAQIIRDNMDHYASIITEEMGKPITQARGEMEKCANLCDYYAENAAHYLADEHIDTEFEKSYTTYEPLGIVFAIMPWNYPFWQVMRFAVPNLMAGNAGLLKHAPNSTGAALAIEEIFIKAGFPEGLFRSLVIDVPLCSYVIEHKKIIGVTLTGSERAGQAVASQSGNALKKVVLELGGSDPYLILEDADLDLAAKECATSRLSNAGQVCISAKRIIVVDSIRDAFLEKLNTELDQFICGDPMNPATTMGPMAREDLRDIVDDQVQRSIAAGAVCTRGGKKVEGDGYYYEPTLFLDVKEGIAAHDEEVFGPVVCVLYARDTQHAIEIANDSPYGLGGAVFTSNVELGEEIAARHINAGMCFVNGKVGSDARLPFGGTKLSGFGRECAQFGVREFMNAKTVVVK